VRTPDRAELQRTLQSHGVQTGIHYPIPVHLQEAYRDLGYSAGDFPHTERAANEVLSLPMFPELTDKQVEFVAAAVHHAGHAI
jgi:dTDP-4-amino-4,6-dideoxygalactose transaminase